MVPSLALGTGEVTLLELTSAYTAFANRGTVSSPRLITRVEDAQGITIYDSPERHTQAISPTTAFLMSSMLADVISSGTGTRRASRGVQAAGGGEDRDDRRLRRRVVRRLHAAPRHRDLVRPGSSRADHARRIRRRRRGSGLGPVHESRDGRGRGRLVRDAGRRREGRDLPAERRARDRRVPAPGGRLQRQWRGHAGAAGSRRRDARRGRGAAGADARGRRDAGLRRSVPPRRRVERAVPAAQPQPVWDCDGVSEPRRRWSIHSSRVSRRPPRARRAAARPSPWHPGPPPPTSSSSASSARTA